VEEAEEMEERKSTRERRPVERYQAGFTALCDKIENEPSSYNEAMTSRDSDDWKEAMDCEIKSQHENASWRLVKRPQGKKILQNRWVYKMKTHPDGSLDKYKARLVVKGFHQV